MKTPSLSAPSGPAPASSSLPRLVWTLRSRRASSLALSAVWRPIASTDSRSAPWRRSRTVLRAIFARKRAVPLNRTSMPSPHSAPCTRLPRIRDPPAAAVGVDHDARPAVDQAVADRDADSGRRGRDVERRDVESRRTGRVVRGDVVAADPHALDVLAVDPAADGPGDLQVAHRRPREQAARRRQRAGSASRVGDARCPAPRQFREHTRPGADQGLVRLELDAAVEHRRTSRRAQHDDPVAAARRLFDRQQGLERAAARTVPTSLGRRADVEGARGDLRGRSRERDRRDDDRRHQAGAHD